jgi:protocatechuate 3,4-dioxygenase beta subunit
MKKKQDYSRREVLWASLSTAPLLAAPGIVRAAARELACATTAIQSEGPFYPTAALEAQNNLIRAADGHGSVRGEPIVVVGRVSDDACRPLAGAEVEIWQADHQGRYHHPDEESRQPLDPYFRYWGRTASDGEGWYRFFTIVPSPYKAGWNWTRPPHIHFKVRGPARSTLTTQMYFPGNPLNQRDYLLNRVERPRRHTLVAARLPEPIRGGPPLPHFRFDIGLA